MLLDKNGVHRFSGWCLCLMGIVPAGTMCTLNETDIAAEPKQERMADQNMPLPYWTPPPPSFKSRRYKKPKKIRP